jgi:hypothetical protein
VTRVSFGKVSFGKGRRRPKNGRRRIRERSFLRRGASHRVH